MMGVKREIRMAKPNPPKLSEHLAELIALEQSGTFSNYGFQARRLERELIEQLFDSGHCLSVCNATMGLMVAIRSTLWRRKKQRKYALMPSYTFAATAHAALWCGLTPLFCDVDADTWLGSEAAEEELLCRYKDEIAVVIPCTTFGNSIDMARYDRYHRRYDVDIVVDAAAALGSKGHEGKQFGQGSRWPIVYSMHATKPFSSGEAGVIYSADSDWIEEMRAMASFGFEQPRVAMLPGLNAKISEIAALTAFLQLQRFEEVVDQRARLKVQYEISLPELKRQSVNGQRQVASYEFVLLPEEIAHLRSHMIEDLKDRGIGTGCYFSPHLAEQSYFAQCSVSGPLPNTETLSHQVLTLPMYDTMTREEVQYVSDELLAVLSKYTERDLTPTAQPCIPEPAYVMGQPA
ncbi:DegT/DnrJ/EryC1/StrS family aminotransferase [Granulicella paludicola]|uniref:DegT/DnrJ/EryC1/StrS family aminotransferase n=1 Tax=Granulicella paludicola TaxID=474951 RepID=UPI0021E091B4|nr:DegT/DnrJ/EryC1/StrS family aminotransferase [Granulicella paludicola]